jgi:DNA-binding NtrC family response regulator
MRNGELHRADKATAAAWIVVESDGDVGRQVYALAPERPNRLGRAADSNILLPDTRCSREHCEIVCRNAQWLLRDLGSRNGTFVGEVRLETEWVLADGQVISIGPFRLLFTTVRDLAEPDCLLHLNETSDGIAAFKSGSGDGSTFIPATERTSVRLRLPGQEPPARDAEPDDDDLAQALIGKSASIRALREHIRRIAPSDATVLIRGESGAGKELVASAIHDHSPRLSGPFVCLNCAALSENLLESELFGHEKGAFTGATDRKIGKFEQAHQGTLFLDEVGEMGLGMQAKFLRALEGHPFQRIGGQAPIRVDVRVVAATNRDLEAAVRDGGFRRDLYFRLHVVQVLIDPLRDRRSDIPVLAAYFLERAGQQGVGGRRVRGFTTRAIDKLYEYSWPGNVRELENTIQRAVIFCQHEWLDADDIQLATLEETALTPQSGGGISYAERSLEEVEISHIIATLESTDWNKSRAAQILGIERSTLDRKLKRHNVRRPPT